MKDFIKNVLILSKVKITIAVSFTTITGYVLANGKFDWGFAWVTLGIFLLACSASVLNHIQEKRTDAIMKRTRNRPLPQGKVTLGQAWTVFSIELLSGIIILYFKVNTQALVLGLIAFFWYNLVYTYLKRITPHAVIPGSIIGAIPPLVGWVAAGATLMNPKAWAIALFFFVWQVPHFYLLVMKYGSQYEKAGMPALTSRYSAFGIRLLIFLWIITTSLAALLLYYFEVIKSRVGTVSIILASVWLIVVFAKPLLKPQADFNPFRYFMRINYYVLFIIIILNIDYLLRLYLA